MSRELWCDDEIATLRHLVGLELGWGEIGQRLGRSGKACRLKFRNMQPPSERPRRNFRGPYKRKYFVRYKPQNQNAARVPEWVAADREHRYALQPRDQTAAFCGDPLPGYSALERRG